MPTSRLFHFFLSSCVIIGSSSGLNVIPDYHMVSGILGDCGKTITNEKDVYVRSHMGAYVMGTVVKYSPNQNCKLTFDAGEGNKVLVKFLNFELENPVGQNNECVDGLKIYNNFTSQIISNTESNSCNLTTETNSTTADTQCNCSSTDNNSTSTDNSTLCISTVTDNSTVSCNTTCTCNQTSLASNTENCNASTSESGTTPDRLVCGTSGLGPFVSDGQEVTFEFYTNDNNHFAGFQLLVTTFKENNTCGSDEFHCDTNRCIDKDFACDTVPHCVDASDEDDVIADCSVLDKIVGYVFGLGKTTILAIVILGSVVIFTIVTSIILYHVVCKKNAIRVRSVEPQQQSSRNDPTTSVRNTEPKKGKKGVTMVEPPRTSSNTTKTPSKTAWDKKSKKKDKENDDEFW